MGEAAPIVGRHPAETILDEFEVFQQKGIKVFDEYSALFDEKCQHEHLVNADIDLNLLHSPSNILGDFFSEPVVGCPGVGEPYLVASPLVKLDVVVDHRLLKHLLAFGFVLGIQPQDFGERDGGS